MIAGMPAIMRPPYVTQAEAAQLAHVSVSTIRRWRKAGKINATSQPDGSLRYSVPNLIAAGLVDRSTPPETPTATPDETDHLSELKAQLATANAEKTALREQLEWAEKLITEIQARADTAEMALKALTRAETYQTAQTSTPAPQTIPQTGQKKRGIIARLFG